MNNWGLVAALMIIVVTTVAIMTINRGSEMDPYEFPAELSLSATEVSAGLDKTLPN